ncbi:hypothetical protein KL930_003388 [Ogataea haglerorum]|uniref:Chitin biosynthesis protein CHS5 n=1 Tax=Ogataea haglerorum TaxID=1937702 RepID=A0ABQ7RIC3_9ASCO|nr:uncharacterized protein KL911_002363 [Ogataea haglerorum]KAG7706822.1 hypothetical protein KL914_002706 [Ogataea haglerorum]KAG7747935.1 hypothetical protein KL912_002612 [Ogataea haglerorum]KAG7753887.1 hypothetical protein KL911_002363 [Ogataea haglerorum]KAG7758555.1 hypothetical protein KL947_002224 [Ogataea haglerorum]KAG7766102.1 hypothetical protein KL946_002282 [Ogataea haglerorum]
MVEVSLTVGKLDASLALLLTQDHHLIEFPTILLPDGISAGSIVKIHCERDLKQEEAEDATFDRLQEEIFNTFGKNEPKSPQLKIVNVTQTSCVLEWEPLELGTAELNSLTLYKNGTKIGQIRSPLSKKNIKLSGLPVDTQYRFHLKLETSAGSYLSNIVELRTHKMTDLSGITVCIGEIDFEGEPFSLQDIEQSLNKIGARPMSKEVKIDTTQFICTRKTGSQYEKAKSLNIPIVRPEWLKACELERRIVGVSKFYLDSENPIWREKEYWGSPRSEIDQGQNRLQTGSTGEDNEDSRDSNTFNTIDPREMFEEQPTEETKPSILKADVEGTSVEPETLAEEKEKVHASELTESGSPTDTHHDSNHQETKEVPENDNTHDTNESFEEKTKWRDHSSLENVRGEDSNQGMKKSKIEANSRDMSQPLLNAESSVQETAVSNDQHDVPDNLELDNNESVKSAGEKGAVGNSEVPVDAEIINTEGNASESLRRKSDQKPSKAVGPEESSCSSSDKKNKGGKKKNRKK